MTCCVMDGAGRFVVPLLLLCFDVAVDFSNIFFFFFIFGYPNIKRTQTHTHTPTDERVRGSCSLKILQKRHKKQINVPIDHVYWDGCGACVFSYISSFEAIELCAFRIFVDCVRWRNNRSCFAQAPKKRKKNPKSKEWNGMLR